MRTGRSPAAALNPARNVSAGTSGGRLKAASAPRVTLKPVRRSMSSMGATKTGTGPSEPAGTARSRSGISCGSQRSPSRKLTGTIPAVSARSITLALSAMKIPRSGSTTLLSSRSVRRA